MKSTVCVMLLLCSFAAFGAEVGQVANVPKIVWTSVANPTSFTAGEKLWRFADECSLFVGGRVQVKALDGARALVEYGPVTHRDERQCPRHALVFVNAADFDGWQAEYERRLKHVEEGKALVRRLLEGRKQ